MKKFINKLNVDISNIKFRYVIVAFLISVLFPVLLMANAWNGHYLDGYRAGDYSFGLYLKTLWDKFLLMYVPSIFIALIIGIPLFYALRNYLKFNPLTVCLVAAFIAIIPNTLIEILSSHENITFYTIGDCTTIENGKRTSCGWMHFWVVNILFVALRGAFAGFVF